MIPFLWGAVAALSAVAMLFFFKFWKQTRDVLFACFAAGFGLMSLHFGALGLLDRTSPLHSHSFLLRLAAFICIIAGVVAKNRQSTAPGSSGRPPARPR